MARPRAQVSAPDTARALHAVDGMHDVHWPLLERILVDDGWVWRDDTLYAPHATLWFTTRNGPPERAEFGDALTDAPADVDKVHLHADLSSLVAALDQLLRGN
jgi:hypothetical protein